MSITLENDIVFSNTCTISENKISGDVFNVESTHTLSPNTSMTCDLSHKNFNISTGIVINAIDFTGNFIKGKKGHVIIKNNTALTHDIDFSMNNLTNNISWVNTNDINATNVNVIEYYCTDDKLLLQHLYDSSSAAAPTGTLNYAIAISFYPDMGTVGNVADYNAHPDKANIELVYRQTLASTMSVPLENVSIVSVVIGSVKFLTEIRFPDTMTSSYINTKLDLISNTPVSVFSETAISNAISTILNSASQNDQENAKEFFIYTQSNINSNGLSVPSNTSTLVKTINNDGSIISNSDLVLNPTYNIVQIGDTYTITSEQISTTLPSWTIVETYNQLNFNYQNTLIVQILASYGCYHELKQGVDTYKYGNTDWSFVVPGITSHTSDISELVIRARGYIQLKFKVVSTTGVSPVTTKPIGIDLGPYWIISSNNENLNFYFTNNNVEWFPAVIFK